MYFIALLINKIFHVIFSISKYFKAIKMNITGALRKNLKKEYTLLQEISKLLYPKALSFRKAKAIINELYEMNLTKDETKLLPLYEDLNTSQKINLAIVQRKKLSILLSKQYPNEMPLNSSDKRLNDLFIPDKSIYNAMEKYKNIGIIRRITFNPEKWLKKNDIKISNALHLFNDNKSNPFIISTKKLQTGVALLGDKESVENTQSKLIEQYIENNNPFVLVKKDDSNLLLNKEHIDNHAKLYNYCPTIEYFNDTLNINLFNEQLLLSLFRGTDTYQHSINNPNKSDYFSKSVEYLVDVFLLIAKSRYKYTFNQEKFFEDLFDFKNILSMASEHIYSFEESIYQYAVKRGKIKEKNTFETYEAIKDDWTDMISEISKVKSKLRHKDNYSIYDNFNHSNKKSNISLCFLEPKSNILKSLIASLISNSKYVFKSTDIESNKLFALSELNEFFNPDWISEARKLNIINCVNVNSTIDKKQFNLLHNLTHYMYFYDDIFTSFYAKSISKSDLNDNLLKLISKNKDFYFNKDSNQKILIK